MSSFLLHKDSQSPLYQSVWRRMRDEDLAPSYTVGMERVLGEKYALLISEVFFMLNYGHDCRLFMLPAVYFPNYLTFALPKNSSLVPIFNKVYVFFILLFYVRIYFIS